MDRIKAPKPAPVEKEGENVDDERLCWREKRLEAFCILQQESPHYDASVSDSAGVKNYRRAPHRDQMKTLLE